VNNLRTQFLNAGPAIAKLIYQTPFNNVNAGLVVDLSKTDLTIDNQGKITLTGFSPIVVLTDPQARIYNRLAIEFNPVSLKMDLDPVSSGKLRFYLTTNDPADPAFPTFVQSTLGANPPAVPGPDPAVVAANGFTPQTYAQVETGIQASEAPLDILDSFVASLPLVSIVEAMHQFAIGVPLTFHFDQGYVIVHGPSTMGAADACGPKAGTTVNTTVTPSPKAPTPATPGSPAQNGFVFNFNHSVSAPWVRR
jgi:hypothetical protein